MIFEDGSARVGSHRAAQVAGKSASSIEDAVADALRRASLPGRVLRWYEIKRTGGRIEGGKASTYEVLLRVGFDAQDPA